MKLTFLGTKGYIDPWTRRHKRHTSLLVSYHGKRVMIDAGEDWSGQIARVNPSAIVVTHAHPDHVGGLSEGVDCPVYATPATWRRIEGFGIGERHTLRPRRETEIVGISFEAFPVEHSLRCPAVGYRIRAGKASIFYVPDVVYIRQRKTALRGVRLYIGDGATLDRGLVRRRGRRLIGHTPVRTQLTWCSKAGVPEAIVTHCGAQIVAGDERKIGALLRQWGKERDVQVEIAHDGMERIVR